MSTRQRSHWPDSAQALLHVQVPSCVKASHAHRHKSTADRNLVQNRRVLLEVLSLDRLNAISILWISSNKAALGFVTPGQMMRACSIWKLESFDLTEE